MKEKSNRYIRQIALPEIGLRGQQLLHDAKVLVIGAGGLGCPVMQQLAAVGVGTVGIVDGDCIEESNLHRQILFTTEDCGKNKAVTASEKLAQINPDVITKVYAEFFTVTNANLISNDYDIIVDCTDTITSRYLINDISLVKNIPMVYASIHKFEGQVSVFNYKNGPSYRCLFPENETKKDVPNCLISGVLGVLPNTLGMIQTTEVLKIILGIGEVLSGKLLLYNALNCQTQLIEYAKNQVEIKRGNERGKRIAIEINSRILELERNQFFEKANTPNCLLIDVRESHEQPRLTFENVLEIPLKKLEVQIENIDKNYEIILFCQSGKRSQFALEIFKEKGFSKLSHLKNGIQSLKLKLSD